MDTMSSAWHHNYHARSVCAQIDNKCLRLPLECVIKKKKRKISHDNFQIKLSRTTCLLRKEKPLVGRFMSSDKVTSVFLLNGSKWK